MKAKDYFEKYENAIIEDVKGNSTSGISKLLIELSEEVEAIYRKRGGKSNCALIGVIKELNQKWNAIGALFEKRYGASPLKRNGFIKYWKNQLPELNQLL